MPRPCVLCKGGYDAACSMAAGNPVKRGLVELPEQWRLSSYRFYLLDEAGPVRVNEGWGKISFRAPAA